MTSIDAGWKYRFRVAGNDQDHGPAFYGVTPASILASPVGTPGRVAYTAGNRATVSVDDLTFINANIKGVINTTSRSNHLWRWEGVGAVSGLDFLTRFTHLFEGFVETHQHRLYIWNDTTSAWLLIDSINTAADPRTMSGGPGSSFDDYVNGSGEIFVLLWNYEGVYMSSAGGCLHATTMITMEDGQRVPAKKVRFGERIMGWVDGARVPMKVDEVTLHYARRWKMIRVDAGGGRRYWVTDDHPCPVGREGESILARYVRSGMLAPDAYGGFHEIRSVVPNEQRCEVVDINVRGVDVRVATYEVGRGLLICNQARP